MIEEYFNAIVLKYKACILDSVSGMTCHNMETKSGRQEVNSIL